MTATISEDQRYRYDLTRTWDPDGPKALWVMLNPSTADSWSDDPTIRRVTAFSKREGMGGLVVVNLMAWRASKPVDLPKSLEAAEGPENVDTYVRWMKDPRVGLVVAAWGAVAPRFRVLAGYMCQALASERDVMCLGTTKNGYPRHPGPLGQVPMDAPLVVYRKTWR